MTGSSQLANSTFEKTYCFSSFGKKILLRVKLGDLPPGFYFSTDLAISNFRTNHCSCCFSHKFNSLLHSLTVERTDGRTDGISPHSTGLCPLPGPLPKKHIVPVRDPREELGGPPEELGGPREELGGPWRKLGGSWMKLGGHREELDGVGGSWEGLGWSWEDLRGS